MARTARPTLAKRLRCSVCGTAQTIHQLRSRNRPAGHVKHVWCVVCRVTTAHIEDGE